MFEQTTESLVWELRKHVWDGHLKLVILGISKGNSSNRYTQGKNKEGREMTKGQDVSGRNIM